MMMRTNRSASSQGSNPLGTGNQNADDSPPEEYAWPIKRVEMGRRGFVTTATAATLSGLGALLFGTDVATRMVKIHPAERVLQEAQKNERKILRSTAEIVVTALGTLAMCDLLDRYKIPHGTMAFAHRTEESLTPGDKALDYALACWAVPLIEESLFRLLPSAFLLEEPGRPIRWDVGLTGSTVFALFHNIGKIDNERYFISLTSIPLEQFALGAFCWHLTRSRGIVDAAAAHSFYNHLCAWYPQGLALRLLGLGPARDKPDTLSNRPSKMP